MFFSDLRLLWWLMKCFLGFKTLMVVFEVFLVFKTLLMFYEMCFFDFRLL